MKKKPKQKTQAQNKRIISDEEFITTFNKVTKKLIYKFKFGYHEAEDMKQQAAIFALEALEKYDHSRPLENFLWTHIRNRLFNFKRDKYQRPDKPCLTCPLYDPKLKCSTSGCSKYNNKLDCDLYNSWLNRNEIKKNLNKLISLDQTYDKSSSLDSINDISNQEIIDLLDTNLSYKYREIFLKLRHGEKVLSADLKKFSIEANRILDLHKFNRDNQ